MHEYRADRRGRRRLRDALQGCGDDGMRLADRNCEGEGASFSRIAFGPYPAQVHGDKIVHDAQSESEALRCAFATGCRLLKSRKQRRRFLARHSGPAIGDAESDKAIPIAVGLN